MADDAATRGPAGRTAAALPTVAPADVPDATPGPQTRCAGCSNPVCRKLGAALGALRADGPTTRVAG